MAFRGVQKPKKEIGGGKMQDIRRKFEEFDKDGSGTISADELDDIMRSLGHKLTKCQINSMIADCDDNGNGVLDFPEFVSLMENVETITSAEQEMFRAFSVFDKDGSGNVDLGELKMVMKNLGYNLTDDELRGMMADGDLDGDGQISYIEFVRLMR